MSYTIVSAAYGDPEHKTAVVMTYEAGAVAASQVDTPGLWAEMLAAVEPSAYVAPVPPPAKTYKADVWRRATDAEAETIAAVLSQQTVRKQRLFNDADYLNHADPEFVELKAGFVQVFGQARADELLAPSA